MGQLDQCVSNLEEKLNDGIRTLEKDLWDQAALDGVQTAVKTRLRERLGKVASNVEARLNSGEEVQKILMMKMERVEQHLTAVEELQSQTKAMLERLKKAY